MGDVGWPFPLRTDVRGRFELVSGVEAIEGAFSSILGTFAGERVMRPDLGIQLDWRADELPERINALLSDAEPRVQIIDVAIDTREQSEEVGHFLRPVVVVRVVYELRKSGERHLFVRGINWI
jgi:phage baseplate assembly protein W